MNNIKNNIGDKKYMLTILNRRRDSIKKKTLLEVKCDCGIIKEIPTSAFGKRKSCGCQKHPKGKKSIHFTGYEQISGGKWTSYKYNAKKRNLEFNINIKYAWNLYEQQKGKCMLSGVDIHFTGFHATASLDRIDNTKGYVSGNVHWVHKKINQIKMDMSTEDFVQWCKKVTDYAD